MTTSVTWSLFSGRRNPQFQLTKTQEREFLERLRTVQAGSAADKELEQVRPFGIGAFSITNWSDRGAMQLRVGGGLVSFPFFHMTLEDSGGLEPWLLDICPERFISPSVKGQLFEILKWRPKAPEVPSAPRPCIPTQAVDSPPFEASFGPGTLCWCNNCYDYANNQQTNTYSQPGFGSGQEFTSHSCADLIAAAKRDGLVEVQDVKTPLGPGDGWYVALFTGTLGAMPDYHWLRQDSTGCWSHKLGEYPAITIDFALNPIRDPEQANLHDPGLVLITYPTFCGYFRTHPGVTIKGHKVAAVDCYDPGY